MDPSLLQQLSRAPDWSLLVGDLGRVLILVGAFAFFSSVILSLLAAKKPSLGRWAAVGFVGGTLCLFGAFASLATLFANDQFQYQYVFSHAERATELKYKIAGVWSGQQGSFLLWACASALFGILTLKAVGSYRRWYIAVYAAFLGALCGILAYETPFHIPDEARHMGAVLMPPDGAGLAPSLQNYWVVIHPPTIFLGFGLLTALFCWSMSAMFSGNLRDWARQSRPWSLLATAILGIGICMGGFWAYETLGWGGFWAWDPVENASFVPWLFLVAFVHGLIVQTTRGRWIGANLLLGALPFLAFLYGTLLTRSGLLTDASVHSFAEMDRKALQILFGILVVAVGGFLATWLSRGLRLAMQEGQPAAADGLTRESAYKGGALLLSLFGLALAFGMSVPALMALLGQSSKVVKEPLYHQVVTWFFLPVMLLIAAGPFLAWRGMGAKALLSRMANVISLSLGLTGMCVLLLKLPRWGAQLDPNATVAAPWGGTFPLLPWMATLLFVCMLATVGNVWRIGEMVRRSKTLSLGGFVSHAGLAVLLAGLILSRGFEKKQQVFLRPDLPARALDYGIAFKQGTTDNPFDRNGKLIFDVTGPDGKFEARPGLFYTRGQDGALNPMTWPHIERGLSHDVYFTLFPPIYDVWEQPQTLKPGETIKLNDVTVRYERMTREGEAGQAGTKFGALLHVTNSEGTFVSNPKLVLGEGGPTIEWASAGRDMNVTLQAMNAADQSVTIQVHFAMPIYPVELFYKPLTFLVWLGAGILTLGGLMSAIYRRAPRKDPVVSDSEPESTVETVEEESDALIPVA